MSEEEAAIFSLFESQKSIESEYDYEDSTEDYYSYEDSTETTPNGLYDEEPNASEKPKSIFGNDDKFKFFFSFNGEDISQPATNPPEITTIRPEPVTRPTISTDVESEEYYDDSDEYYDDEYEYYDDDEEYEYYSDEEYEDFSAEATERPKSVFSAFSTVQPLVRTTTENPLSEQDEATREKLQAWREKWQAEQQRIWDKQKEQLKILEEQGSQRLQESTTTTTEAPFIPETEPPKFSIFPLTTTVKPTRKHKKKHKTSKTIKPSKTSAFTVFNPSADFESLKTSSNLQITTRRPHFDVFNGVSVNEIKPGRLQSSQQAVPEQDPVVKDKSSEESDIVMGTFIVDLEPEVPTTTGTPLAAYGAPAETPDNDDDEDYYSDEYYSEEDEDFGLPDTEGMIGSIFGVSAPQETTTTTTTQGPPVTTMRFSPPPQKRPETTTVRIFAPEPTTTPVPAPAPTESFRTVRPARPRRPNRPLTKSEKLARIQQRLKQLNSNGRWEKRNRKKLGRRVVLRDGQSPFLAAAQARESTAVSSETPASEAPLKIVRTSKKVRKLNAARQRRKKFGSKLEQLLL